MNEEPKTIDVEAEPQVPARIESGALTPSQPIQPATAAQAKVDAVASLTMSAYAKASTLNLTSEEIEKLQAEFPDEAFKAGASGKEHLIYIEHAYLRDRLNQVFGPGQWAIIPRNRWAEDFRTAKNVEASRVYVEAMLLIRGCFVAEAVGDMVYYKNNDSQNYGDAVEGAKTAALRRCAKELGIGLQAWKKDFCEGWWQRKRGGKPAPQKAPPPTRPAATTKQATQSTGATEAHKRVFLQRIEPVKDAARALFITWGWITTERGLDAIPLEKVPATKEQFDSLMADIQAFMDGPSESEEAWRDFVMPFGKDKGTTLGELNKKTLFGWWANYEVETEYNGKPKKPETIAKDQEFRDMLDAAGEHHEFTKKD
jgi:hypothetical protein